MKGRKQTRRRFLKMLGAGAAAGAAALPCVVPSVVLGGKGRVAPSDRITVGCIGVGNQGAAVMRNFLGQDAARVVAVCDVNARRLAVGKDHVNRRYGGSGCAVYRDFRELLARDDVDAGLSLRLAENLTGFEVLDSEGRRNLKAHGQSARWMDFSAACDGRAAGVALFDHPRNPRHPCPWYVSMRGPKKNNFSTAPLFNEPYKLPAGKSLTLRYRALVHPQRGRKDLLEKEWNAFAKSKTP